MSRRYVSGVASRGAFQFIGGHWVKSGDMAPNSQWGWSVRTPSGWCAPQITKPEADAEAARMVTP